jgi:hypothetical protein
MAVMLVQHGWTLDIPAVYFAHNDSRVLDHHNVFSFASGIEGSPCLFQKTTGRKVSLAWFLITWFILLTRLFKINLL